MERTEKLKEQKFPSAGEDAKLCEEKNFDSSGFSVEETTISAFMVLTAGT